MNTFANRWQRRVVGTLAAAVVLIAPARLRGQQTPAPEQAPAASAPAEQQGPIIRKESKLVLVDAVVTDKKGSYVHDLTQKDFKVFEDNKEQQVASFSVGSDAALQANNGQKHYLVLFFDNSSMAAPDQIQARGAAAKFVDANAGPDRVMAVAEFGGVLRIAQNFTANPDVLRAAISGVKTAFVASNVSPDPSGSGGGSLPGFSASNAEAEYGARSMLLAVRSLAKNLRSVPGRKIMVLFSAGFVLTPLGLTPLGLIW